MSGNIHSDFAGGDRDVRIDAVRNFLDTAAAVSEIEDYKQQIRAHLALQPGETFLDVGCGMGHEICRWGIEVPGARLIGLDREAVVREAAERAKQLEVDVHWLAANAEAIPLPDHSVDACMTERVLKYLPEPDQALAEITRVLKPEGRFASFELDYDATVLGGPKDIAASILNVLCETVGESRMGRRLPDMLEEHGMVDLSWSPVAFSPPWEIQDAVLVDTVREAIDSEKLPDAPASDWLEQHAAAYGTGRFTVAFVGCMVTGRMPA